MVSLCGRLLPIYICQKRHPDEDNIPLCTEPKVLAREIADRIKNELGFTVNVGISSNKFLAKTASDFSKPDKIHTLFQMSLTEWSRIN